MNAQIVLLVLIGVLAAVVITLARRRSKRRRLYTARSFGSGTQRVEKTAEPVDVAASASSPDAETGDPIEAMRLLEIVRYFQKMGFFEDLTGLSDRDTVARIRDRLNDLWDRPVFEITDDPQGIDMAVLATDRSRVFFKELEAAVPGENVLAGVIKRLAAISDGAFAPEGVVENWLGERGPVELSFDLGGREESVVADGSKILDMSMIDQINELLFVTPYRLKVCDNLDMEPFILMLTEQEAARLEAKRRWVFR